MWPRNLFRRYLKAIPTIVSTGCMFTRIIYHR